jgi:hypothetical protein
VASRVQRIAKEYGWSVAWQPTVVNILTAVLYCTWHITYVCYQADHMNAHIMVDCKLSEILLKLCLFAIPEHSCENYVRTNFFFSFINLSLYLLRDFFFSDFKQV